MSSSQATDHLHIWIQEKPATNRIQKYCDEIRNDIEEKMNRKLMDFISINYIEQVMLGSTHYIVKIHDNGKVYVHVKFYVVLTRDGEKLSFKEVQDNKKEEELIIPF